MRTIVITGITGKSGRFFLKRLIQEASNLSDYQFIFLCRNLTENFLPFQEALASPLNFQIKQADLLHTEDLESILDESVYMLFHIAGINLSSHLIPIALKKGINRFVLVHTTGIYSKYKAAGEGYRQIEAEIHNLINRYRQDNRDIALTILRPTMIYGDLKDKNVSTFIKMVDRFRIFPTVNGARYELQPVWCKDLGDAYFAVLTQWDTTKNKEYILSGGTPIQLREMLTVIATQLGVKNKYISCPYPIAYIGAWFVHFLTF